MTERSGEAPGVAARRAALQLLDAVERRGATVEQASGQALRGVSGPDRGLALAIVGEVLRWRQALDRLIDSATAQPLPADAKARAVLRIALAQLLRLSTPAHAVIATALPLLAGGPRRLVHGVLGRLSREGARLPERPPLPASVAERWHAAWGEEVVADAERALGQPPPLDLRLAEPAVTADWLDQLGGESLMPGHLRLPRPGALEALPGYGEGAWWVQDIAAQLPAQLLGDPPAGSRALDLCAAPGGKALQLASAGWRVLALDRSRGRLKRLHANAARVALPSPETVAADLLDWDSDERFDAVLLDAPCSATGTFRRHPEVLLRTPGLAETRAFQARALARAARWLSPEGRLIYAVCSLEPEEGEAQLAAAAAAGLMLDPVLPGELPGDLGLTEQGLVRTLPGMLAEVGGCDSFFIARFRRA